MCPVGRKDGLWSEEYVLPIALRCIGVISRITVKCMLSDEHLERH